MKILISFIYLLIQICISSENSFRNLLSSQTVIRQISRTGKNLLTINITIGSNNQTFRALIDTTSSLSWVGEKGSNLEIKNLYAPSESSSFKNISTKFEYEYLSEKKGKISGYLAEDNISINGKVFNLQFGVVQSSSFFTDDFDCVLGIGSHYDKIKLSQNFELNESQSVLYQLKNSKSIGNKTFSIDITNNSPSLYIGAYTDEFEHRRNHTSFCNLRSTKTDYRDYSPIWSCRMSHLLIGDTTEENFSSNKIEVYSEVVFDSTSEIILFPQKYYANNKEYFNKNYYDCEYLVSGNKTTIRCKSLENVPQMSLILNGYALTLDNTLLFKKYEDFYEMQLSFSDMVEDIVIGLPFFEQFQIAFDGEKNILLFYHSNRTMFNFRKFTDDKDFLFKDHIALVISMIIVFIIFISIGAIMFIRFKRRQNEKKTLEQASYSKLI